MVNKISSEPFTVEEDYLTEATNTWNTDNLQLPVALKLRSDATEFFSYDSGSDSIMNYSLNETFHSVMTSRNETVISMMTSHNRTILRAFDSLTYSAPEMILVGIVLVLVIVVTAFGNFLVCFALLK